MPSSAAFQEAARSGAGFRSLPGFARPPNSTRLGKMDSMKALGCQGLRVGSAPMGSVTVPPELGAGVAALAGAGAVGFGAAVACDAGGLVGAAGDGDAQAAARPTRL